MNKVPCANCRSWFVPNPRIKNHRYCKKTECQRARKASWQRQKIAGDPDYQADKRDCQTAWRDRNQQYWRNWRTRHPEYVKRNRMLQKERRGRHKSSVAKMDASEPVLGIKTGNYYLLPARVESVAKIDASTPKVRLILMT